MFGKPQHRSGCRREWKKYIFSWGKSKRYSSSVSSKPKFLYGLNIFVLSYFQNFFTCHQFSSCPL